MLLAPLSGSPRQVLMWMTTSSAGVSGFMSESELRIPATRFTRFCGSLGELQTLLVIRLRRRDQQAVRTLQRAFRLVNRCVSAQS